MCQICKILESEVSDIVSIHLDAFPNFFLSNLGKDVLYQFYTYLLRDKNTISYCLKEKDVIVGFIIVSTQARGLYTRIFTRGFFNFLLPIFFSFLKNPSLIKRMIISITSTRKHKTPNNTSVSILSICVRQFNAGKGIGKRLVEKLEMELIQKNIERYYLTTDADNNDLTNSFYLKNNFVLYSSFLQGKRRMNLYIKNL
jgi:ribosomal protein S18 acetylase RimI-like enzyme